jgi:hypothetical protein
VTKQVCTLLFPKGIKEEKLENASQCLLINLAFNGCAMVKTHIQINAIDAISLSVACHPIR